MKKTIAVEPGTFFLLGYWSNPYSRTTDHEYFWMGPFDYRDKAVAAGVGKQKNGQPKRFTNWVKGANRIFRTWDKFEAAALKAGIRPSNPME